MSDAVWAFLASDLATFAAVLIAWIQVRKPVKKLGNGFSDRVEDQLREIKSIAIEARDEIREHINEHAKASMRSKSER